VTVQLAPRVHRIRMLGTAALDLAWVAAGRLDASVILGNTPWDTAAGVLIAREAGATVVDADGTPHGPTSAATITGHPALVGQLVPLIQSADLNHAHSQDTPVGHTPPYATLDAVLSQARHPLFEFDGPVCDLSAALPPGHAKRLRAVIGLEGAELIAACDETDDLFKMVASMGFSISRALAARIEAILTELEVSAAERAAPAAYIHEAVAACRDSGRSVGVVGRNAAQAVRSWLTRYGLEDQIAHVTALESYPPGHFGALLALVEDAIFAQGTAPESCAFITGAELGIEAARNLGAYSIGYAITPDANQRLAAAGADCIVPSLADLTLRLRARPLPN